tara:strand:+ start:394 stop:1992 length:1599 start_codon:yes stop_codon:yes gene_type:complete
VTKSKQKYDSHETSGLKTFTVKSPLKEIKTNINITTDDTLSNLSRNEIINQAFIFHSQGKIKEAIKYYQYFINKGFEDPRVFSNYGVILDELGLTNKAIILFKKSISLFPNSADSYSNLGRILKGLGELDKAKKLMQKAIELKPDFASAHNTLGNILTELYDFKQAEISLRKAIYLKPNFAEAHSNIGNTLQKQGKFQEAEISVRNAIKLKPNFATAYLNLGNILRDIGKLKEAEIYYSKAISLKNDFTLALNNRSQVFFEMKKFDLALKDADACNTKNTRAFALEILYSLGKIDEIYERIKNTSKLDANNIRLAAFSSFISTQEKKVTSNNFCPNPLSYLYYSNLKFHGKGYLDFIKNIINDLSKVETIWQPLEKTTRNGFQTPFHINLFSDPSVNISRLKSIIFHELDVYYSKFKNESCSFIQKWPAKRNLVGWHVILKKQGFQKAHIHPEGWLSGVIYLKVVPPLDKHEGAIEFSLNGENYSNANSPELIYQPNLGDIVFFPSSLHHRTIPFTTNTDRIVLAFDLIPEK